MELDVPRFDGCTHNQSYPWYINVSQKNIIVMVDEVCLVPRERPNGNPALLLFLATREVSVQPVVLSSQYSQSFRSPDSNNHTIQTFAKTIHYFWINTSVQLLKLGYRSTTSVSTESMSTSDSGVFNNKRDYLSNSR